MRCPVVGCPARISACDDPEKAVFGDLERLDEQIAGRLSKIVAARDANPGVCFFDESTRTKFNSDGSRRISQETSVGLCKSLQIAGMKRHHFGGEGEPWALLYEPL